MARITGSGGVFFKSKGDPVASAASYQRHLGLKPESFGAPSSNSRTTRPRIAALKPPIERRAQSRRRTGRRTGFRANAEGIQP